MSLLAWRAAPAQRGLQTRALGARGDFKQSYGFRGGAAVAQESKELGPKAAETRAKNASKQTSNDDVSSYVQGALGQDEDASAAFSLLMTDRSGCVGGRFRSPNRVKVASISRLESCGRQQINRATSLQSFAANA